MRNLKKIYQLSLRSVFLLIGLISIGQFSFATSIESEPIIEPDMPIYEYLGMSSGSLTIVLVLITLLLVTIVFSLTSSTNNIIEYKKKNGSMKAIVTLFAIGLSSQVFAADTVNETATVFMTDTVFWVFIIFDVILVLIIIMLTRLMRNLISEYTQTIKYFNINKWWSKKMVAAAPLNSEASILLDHEYDGIKELDNNLPPWWKYGFYITIAWAIGYFFYYQILEIGPLQDAEYQLEMEEGERMVAEYKEAHPELINAENVVLLEDKNSIRKGLEIYNASCSSCHMDGGAGGIGPNLTDDYWLYDNDIKGVFTTTSEGAENGMIAWKELMSPDKIQAVSSYILQMEYIAPPNGKEPQGEKK